jgi:hypothetical protein
MKKHTLLYICTFAFCMLLVPYANAQEQYSSYRIIAKLKTSQAANIRKGSGPDGISIEHASIQSLNKQYGVSATQRLAPPSSKGPVSDNISRIVIFEFTQPQDITQVIKAYKASGLFEYVEPDYILNIDKPYLPINISMIM